MKDNTYDFKCAKGYLGAHIFRLFIPEFILYDDDDDISELQQKASLWIGGGLKCHYLPFFEFSHGAKCFI